MATQDLLQDSINVFLSYDWEIRHHVGNSAQLEKESLDIASWVAVGGPIVFGLLGGYLINRRRSMNTVTLAYRDDGQIQITGKKVSMTASRADQLISFANVEAGISSTTIWAIAIVATIVWFGFSSATSS